MINVRGFIRAELNLLKSLTEIPSTPAEFLVRREDKCFSTSFSLTNLKSNDTSTRFLRKVSQILFEAGLIWVAILGPILAKNSLNLLHISFLSLITLESTMILFNVFRFVFDLQMMSEIVCHVFFISPLYWVNNLS